MLESDPWSSPSDEPGPSRGPRRAGRSDGRNGSWPRRLIAWLVDLALVAGTTTAIVAARASSTTPEDLAASPVWAAAAPVAFCVFALFPALARTASPGMLVAGLRLSTISGGPVRFRHHLVRTVVGIIDVLPGAVPGLLGFVIARFSPDRQRLGDRVAGTRVVDRSSTGRPADPAGRSTSGRLSKMPEPAGPTVTPTVAARRWAVDDDDLELAPTVAATVEGRPRRIGPSTPPSHRRTASAPTAEPTRDQGPSSDPTLDMARSRILSAGRAAETAADPDADEPGVDADAGQGGVVWSAENQSWMYRHPDSGRWYRHDLEADRWVPVDR